MTDWYITVPSDQVEAVALMQAREPQRSPHPFSFLLLIRRLHPDVAR